MNVKEIIDNHNLVLTEAAVIETLRRSGKVDLHPRLEHALLIYDEAGRKALSALYQDFIKVACKADVPIMICTPTWRANEERISTAGITRNINGDAVNFLKQLKKQWESWASNIIIGGLVGCQNDSYEPEQGLSRIEAQAFHHWQITRLAEAGVDFLVGVTLPALSEATGIALAMAQTRIPYLISFVINKEGNLLDGNSLENAFQEIDAVCSGRQPIGYMINCAYPSFFNAHNQPQSVLSRLVGYQANASSLNHTQLNEAETLQADDLSDWGNLMIELNKKFGVKILGGCCGTSHEHLRYITRNIDSRQVR